MFLKGWDLPSGCQVAPRAAPWLPVVLEILFCFVICVASILFIKFSGPTREAQGQGTRRGKASRAQVNIDFFMNIGAGAQVLTTFGTFGFPGPVEKDITSGNIVSQLTLCQLR